jgi:hypothetical protein
MPGRNLVGESDRPGGERKGHRQEEEGMHAEETPQMPQTRHGRTIGGDRGNPGRFRYDTRMNGAKIPHLG